MEIEKVIKYPLSTEKSIRLMEAENKLVFVVDMRAKKPEIKEAIERTFKVKVDKVTTLITPKGKKRAYVRLSPETPALDVATDLGLM
ncbi:50S ribosomal protein L23 [Candidatus Woesearchaeota archaeon]|nr:50S ribosomal protein L23 [Candidatus Woesearchaeota archaeon]